MFGRTLVLQALEYGSVLLKKGEKKVPIDSPCRKILAVAMDRTRADTEFHQERATMLSWTLCLLVLLSFATTSCLAAASCSQISNTKQAIISCTPPPSVNLELDYGAIRMVCNGSKHLFAQFDFGSINVQGTPYSRWLMTGPACSMFSRRIDANLLCKWECIGVDYSNQKHSLCQVSTLPSCKIATTGRPSTASPQMTKPPSETATAYTPVHTGSGTTLEENTSVYNATTHGSSTGTTRQAPPSVIHTSRTPATSFHTYLSSPVSDELSSATSPEHMTKPGTSDPSASTIVAPLLAVLIGIVFLILVVMVKRVPCRKGSEVIHSQEGIREVGSGADLERGDAGQMAQHGEQYLQIAQRVSTDEPGGEPYIVDNLQRNSVCNRINAWGTYPVQATVYEQLQGTSPSSLEPSNTMQPDMQIHEDLKPDVSFPDRGHSDGAKIDACIHRHITTDAQPTQPDDDDDDKYVVHGGKELCFHDVQHVR